jgi:hypothetical protein
MASVAPSKAASSALTSWGSIKALSAAFTFASWYAKSAFTATFSSFASFSVAKSAFALWSRFCFFWRRGFFVFLADFVYAFVYVYFEVVANVVSLAKGICARSYSKFTRNYTGNLSTLPPFSVMQQRVLED